MKSKDLDRYGPNNANLAAAETYKQYDQPKNPTVSTVAENEVLLNDEKVPKTGHY